MIREVDLTQYLPEFMQIYKEPVVTLGAENPEFNIIWDAVDRVLHNRFISTADKYGISRFEKMLNIHPSATDDLETRRMRVQNRWFNEIPYTLKTLLIKMIELLGSECDFSINADFEQGYELELILYSITDSELNELKHLLSVIVPMNISINIIHEKTLTGNIYVGAHMIESDILTLKQR